MSRRGDTGFEGRPASIACAGRRYRPTTKQQTSAVFRARPPKAQVPSPQPKTQEHNSCVFFLWVRYAGIEERQNKEKIKKQAITLFFLRKLWYIYIADINCRCRLAVWRQLPKLISAGPTPVTCSKNAKLFRASFFL